MPKRQRMELIFLAGLVFSLAFVVVLLIAYVPEIAADGGIRPANVFLLAIAFVAYVIGASSAIEHLLTQFAQRFYDLSWEDAGELVGHLLGGLPERPPRRPFLRVMGGQVDPDGPVVMQKVGGPGYLSIAHDSAVVTWKLGKLYRVLEPGFYQLEPFERVWDVIDLRPQRRTLRVEFMTLDGIPAYCDTEIRFRVAGPSAEVLLENAESPKPSYPFDKEAVLRLAMAKFVRSHEGGGQIQDWCIGLVHGAFDGILRDELERYKLDEYWAMPDGTTTAGGTSSSATSPLLKTIQKRVEDNVTAVAKSRGITVESVYMAPVQPAEEAISRQWLEFWQARLQRETAAYTMAEEAKRVDMLTQAQVNAQVELINAMLVRIRDLADKDVQVPAQLIVMSFVDVLRAMSDRDAAVQQLMFQQAESLIRVVNAIQKKKTPFGPSVPPTSPRLPRPKV